MNKLSLTESELKETMVKIYKEEQIKLLDEKWNKLSGIDRQFVLEFLKVIYPEKAMLVTESRWYNTVGDIVGIFDPTGVVDIVNGISYWRQGDKLFAILSWISAVPYLGDLIAKPVVGVMKFGGGATKAFKAHTLLKRLRRGLEGVQGACATKATKATKALEAQTCSTNACANV